MGAKPNYDFSGYATKNGLKCTDGRIIQKDAFKHNDGKTVPLVWQHLHNEPINILGHAILENRDDGVYAYGIFNNSETAQNAKELVAHGDITELSIYANGLKQNGPNVVHGMIREVSLVLAGANPEAKIDNLNFAHTDGTYTPSEDEAVIYTGLTLSTDVVEHMSDSDGEKILSDELASLTDEQRNRLSERMKYTMNDSQIDIIFQIISTLTANQRNNLYKMVGDNIAMHSETDESGAILEHAKKYADDATVQDIFDTLDETQKNVVYAMIAQAIGEESGEVEHSDKEGDMIVKTNVFDQSTVTTDTPVLSHSQMLDIMADAKKCGSLKDAVLAHAAEYGIENIDILFPDARNIRNTPDIIKRDDSWVSGFLSGTYKTPFSRIKSMAADWTEDVLRAKGYITGNKKKEEIFPVLKRTTTPTTIYKKQKLDRDDIIDITGFDVVAWIRGDMRVALDEEVARAALIGDGRAVDSEDKIAEDHVRPIWKDDELYAPKVLFEANQTTLDLIDDIVRARKKYKGSGNPNLYTTEELITDMLLVRDLNQRRIYPTMAELASALRVNQLIAVEVMEDQSRTLPNSAEIVDLIGILVNPRDYTFGADKGGQISTFEDFDIDYNQQKYLMETRCSGALTKPKSAVIFERKRAAG